MNQQAVNQAFDAQWVSTEDPRLPVLVLSGYVNGAVGATLETLLQEALRAHRLYWVVDLGRVPVVNAAGFAALDAVRRSLLAQGGAFALIHIQPIVRRALLINGDTLGRCCFERYADVQSAWQGHLQR